MEKNTSNYQLLVPELLPETVGTMLVFVPHKMWRQDMVAGLVHKVVERNHVDAVIVVSPRNHIHGYMGAMAKHRMDCGPEDVESLIHGIHKEDPRHRVCVVWDSISADHVKAFVKSKCLTSPEILNMINIVAMAAADDVSPAVRNQLVNQSQVILMASNTNANKMWTNYQMCPWESGVEKKDFTAWLETELSFIRAPDQAEIAIVVFPDSSRMQRRLYQHVAFTVAPFYAVQLPLSVAQQHGYRVRGKPRCEPTPAEERAYGELCAEEDEEWVRVWGEYSARPFASTDLVHRTINSMRLSCR